MFEHKSHRLLPPKQFLLRLLRMAAIAAFIILGALLIGTLGFILTDRLPLIDAILNAAMLLSGMGPLHPPNSSACKLFAAAYALFSGIIFLTVAAVLFAPVFHRFIHRFHLELTDDDQDNSTSR